VGVVGSEHDHRVEIPAEQIVRVGDRSDPHAAPAPVEVPGAPAARTRPDHTDPQLIHVGRVW
jgi:hypothetical protein